MKKNEILLPLVMLVCLCLSCSQSMKQPQEALRKPNIVLIYADDLGYGDVGCYGSTAIPTPHIDRLAREGRVFRDGHCTSATCTPSRYGLLTGQYPWRNKRAKILDGDAGMLIRLGTPTLPAMLQRAGYTTGVIGKWHLGLGAGAINWNKPVKPGPNEIGFDYSFIMAATNDRVPTVYLRNGKVLGLDPNDPIEINYRQNFPGEPTGQSHPERLKQQGDLQHSATIVNGVARIGYMRGGTAARWVDEDMTDVFAEEVAAFLERQTDKPFFLYYALEDPHQPRLPHPRFVGATDLGPRGDVIVEVDWCVGRVREILTQLGLADNTLIFFSSDNGPVLNDGYEDQAVERNGDHRPGGPYRGGKYSLLEAGTRVPTIVHWPGHIAPSESNALMSQLDLYASLTCLVGESLEPNAAPDSLNMLPTLLGDSDEGIETFVHQPIFDGCLALRQGPWKYIPPYKGSLMVWTKGVESGRNPNPVPQLYHLGDDPSESRNLATEQPKRVQAMQDRLDAIQRSRGLRFEKQ